MDGKPRFRMCKVFGSSTPPPPPGELGQTSNLKMTNGNHPRKLQSLMIKHKHKALLQLVQGSISIKKLAKENKVDPKTIRDWRKNADKIFTYRGRTVVKWYQLGIV
eukprot:NODE_672_length_4853_cov_0.171855.p4 type:complete len:106 gc:universal NODE_672_length_4853_cov_0.171855:3377-3694(+)